MVQIDMALREKMTKLPPYKYQVQMGCCQLQDPTPFVTHYGKKIENDLSPLLNIIEDIITAEQVFLVEGLTKRHG